MLRQNLAILRVSSTGGTDDDNLPVYGAPATIATVPGLIQPLTMVEQAQLADMGAEAATYRAFLYPTDVQTSDKLQDVTAGSGPVYEVRALLDWSAYPEPYYELMLWRATD